MGRKEANPGSFKPSKWGDGGKIHAPARTRHIRIEFVEFSPDATKRANSRVVMNCVPPEDVDARTTPTEDPYDRAHQCEIGGMLLPSATVSEGRTIENTQLRAKPRRYTSCYIVPQWNRDRTRVRFVSFESKLDDFQRAKYRLDGIPGIGAKRQPSPLDNIYTRTDGDEAFRAIHRALALFQCSTHRKEFDDRTEDERAADAAADAWLANHENGGQTCR